MNSKMPRSNERGADQPFQAIFPGTVQNITSSGVSQQSAALGAATSIVRIACIEATYVEIGSNPTASTSSMILPAGSVEYFGVTGGHKIAVRQVSSAGLVSITEGA